MQQALSLIDGLQWSYELTTDSVLTALQSAHRASSEYYIWDTSNTIKHAMEWDTSFVIPPEAIAADSAFFRDCENDFAKMCKHKQSLLASNRISLQRIHSIFGTDGTKIPTRCQNLK